ncbi:MAG: ATP-dependent Clp protease proteolytic subunit [Candidatus Parcubacteria bacterium]|nr:ATP-dependent Clp protease proteolytic subunit [Candidatus Parcubacteria bacterium]
MYNTNNEYDEFLFCDAPLSSITRYIQNRNEMFSDTFEKAINVKLLDGAEPEINLFGFVDENMASNVRESLKFLKMKGSPPVRVNITSDGGFVRSGMGIHDQLLLYPGGAQGVVCEYVSSAAIQLLLQGCMGRAATANTEFFCHYCQGVMRTNARILRKDKARMLMIEEFEKINDKMVRILMDRTMRSEKEIRRMLTRERSVSAEEAFEFGLIDQIIPLTMIRKPRVQKAP